MAKLWSYFQETKSLRVWFQWETSKSRTETERRKENKFLFGVKMQLSSGLEDEQDPHKTPPGVVFMENFALHRLKEV